MHIQNRCCTENVFQLPIVDKFQEMEVVQDEYHKLLKELPKSYLK